MAISGPKVQIPSSLSEIFNYDEKGKITSIKPEWAAFWSSLQQITFAVSRSGPTSSRPNYNFDGRFVGMPYFDTSLGLPVFLKIASTSVWVDAAGAVV